MDSIEIQTDNNLKFSGDSMLEIPEKYIAKIGTDGFTSFHHVEEKEIKTKVGDIVGTMIIAIQLSSKCSM